MQDLSIIIPVYNNRAGLISTLLSIGEIAQTVLDWGIKVIIVDDCSTEVNYDDIPQLFTSFVDITLFRLSENSGPGQARQYGLDHSDTEYVMFLDAGDVLSFPTHFIQLMDLVLRHPDIKVFSCGREGISDTRQIGYVGPAHNKIHGKIYRLDFLKNYNIRFISDHYYSEDIGFNLACRLVCAELERRKNETQLFEFPKPITTELFDGNSITRKNNGEFKYTENYGLGYNLVHALEIALSNGVHPSIIEVYGYENLICQYIFFYEAYTHQKGLEKSLEGCRYWYRNFKYCIPKFNEQLLTKVYNDMMKKLYAEDVEYAFNTTIPKLSFWDFINLLEKEDKE